MPHYLVRQRRSGHKWSSNRRRHGVPFQFFSFLDMAAMQSPFAAVVFIRFAVTVTNGRDRRFSQGSSEAAR
jgi:hypothetical protein